MPVNSSPQLKSVGPFAAFLILSGISTAILLAGLVLGTEPRLALERTGEGEFRATASNHFAGRQFYAKTIDGVREVRTDDAAHAGRRYSPEEMRRRRRQKHLDLFGRDGARVGWDRETDRSTIEAFMRGSEPTLALTDPPPGWRMAAAWFCVGLGGLSLIGAVRSSFFPAPNAKPPVFRA